MLIESFRIALANWSAGSRAGSAPIAAQQPSKNVRAKNCLTRLMTAQRKPARRDCQRKGGSRSLLRDAKTNGEATLTKRVEDNAFHLVSAMKLL